jgi:hypothetical protein
MTELKETIAAMLTKLPFVRWDRFTNTGWEVNVYGWIDREQDGYKDFVVLQYVPSKDEWYSITSSDKHSEEINRLVHGETGEHHPCVRVESQFDIPNMIKLNDQ